MSESPAHRCKLEECTVATTGKCVEGLDLSGCPNYINPAPEPEAEFDTVEVSRVETQVQPAQPAEELTVDLPNGLDFDPTTASQITRAQLTRVIVIAGDKDSGKTTLVSSLYDRFQEGPFAGYLFAGCGTLPGLERRSFPSRIASDRVTPDTTRTTRGDGQKLLHLKFRVQDLSRPSQDVMLSDISGEFFKDACNSTEGCRQLRILNRADHLALCLDGEKLASTTFRHEAFHTGVLLLQSALDAGMIGVRTFVDVLFTKRDLLGPPQGSTALDYVDGIRQKMTTQFERSFGRLRFFEVAARPSSLEFPFAYGLDQILPSWIEDTPLYAQPKPLDARILAASLAQTEFDRYALKR